MSAIHQFTAGFTPGDAISNEAALFRDIFRSWGYTSEIFSEESCIRKSAHNNVVDVDNCVVAADDIVLLHLSIGSKVNESFKTLKCKKVILYHNITPSHYFTLVNKQTESNLKRGRRQVEGLSQTADINLAVSKFNASELTELGYQNVEVLPLVLDFSMLTSKIDSHMSGKLKDGKKNVLFVGRCTPNKKLEDLLQTFAYYQKTIEPNSRLIHVGSHAGSEHYYNILTGIVHELNINNVMFTGPISQPELNACYASSDAFLCMSEHEGFCIPLIESMLHELPILAHASAAIPETLDGSGVLMKERNYGLAAELLNQIIANEALRTAVITQQSERLARYNSRDLRSELKDHLAGLL